MHVSVVNAGVPNYRVGFCRQISIVRVYVNISVFKDSYTDVSRGKFKILQIWGDIAITQSVKIGGATDEHVMLVRLVPTFCWILAGGGGIR